MATKDKAIQSAKDAANRTGKCYSIYQSNNHQWLYAPATSQASNEVVKSGKPVYFFYPNQQ